MVRIEVIGLEPPCIKCNELLENAKKAAKDAGVDAEVVKLWILSEDVRQKYGLLLVYLCGCRPIYGIHNETTIWDILW